MAVREKRVSVARSRESALRAAIAAPRIVIEVVAPIVLGGRFPAKGTVERATTVEATIFMDGHQELAAALLWKRSDQTRWQIEPMQSLGNDRWQAQFVPGKPGTYQYLIEAWLSPWLSFHEELRKKCEAGVVQPVEIEEGRLQIEAALTSARGRVGRLLQSVLDKSEGLASDAACSLLLSDNLTSVMKSVEQRRFICRLERPLLVEVERRRAEFASWYELFPRSQTDRPDRHGTFDDVIARLPAIRAMGFDVLYLPPIHPIGLTHRKGRNNARVAIHDDPGSPYAIGAAEGGHTAVHPELGGIEGFRRLRAAVADVDMELALDFAIQCSPDHPWLTEHPEWFAWRPDGSIRYAENPPKKYEDIVNVEFYRGDEALPEVWTALRDVVEFWAKEGVSIFRVDNPHTKPLPFWQWLIADIRSRYPDTIFLSEAFTRPPMMYRLAQIGFNQSYTYFTWRNDKWELSSYLEELNRPPVSDFYRPNFFVNTPDINPWYLQTSGRAGFVIRAALAATLSGLWGVYSGFELCESAAVPGKEEYLDSEKYEIRPRDWNAPGNIIGEITRLNYLRRQYRCLQSHLGTRFHHVDNDQVIFFSRRAGPAEPLLLIAISLDPHHAQGCYLDIPLELFGQPDSATLEVHELIGGGRFLWHGRTQHWWFNPHEQPFAVWEARPLGEGTA